MSINREVISTQHAPAAVGPYSQAIRVGHFIYTAGQIGLVPETGKLIEEGIEAQTRQVMQNLSHILKAAESDLDQVIKTTIYITDLGNFGKINEIYGRFFKNNPPARSTVEVAALPLGADIEIEAVAFVPQS